MRVALAKFVMKRFECFPRDPAANVGESAEIFQHDVFLRASPEERREIFRQSSQSKYESELDYPWDHYFGRDLSGDLAGKRILDLGCFNGGRGAAWFERYGLRSLVGIDVARPFLQAARSFAAHQQLRARYAMAVGENLPFTDGAFDAILTYDVLEHVRDIERTMAECQRILAPGGRMYLVFPGYFHPTEHHLAMVTRAPGIHYLFSGRTLVRAYYELLAERGAAADWYRRDTPELEPWERGHTINGTTLGRFETILARQRWSVLERVHKALGSIGRNVQRNRLARIVARLLTPATYLPGLREVALHRFTFVLEKPR